MATLNPFDLLNDDAEDPSQIAAQQELAAPAKKAPEKAQAQAKPAAAAAAAAADPGKAAKLPSKPLPPAEAVREARNDAGRGGRGGRGYGRGRGGVSGGYRREYTNDENSFGNTVVGGGQGGPPEDGDTGKQSERRGGYGGPRPYRAGRRGGYTNGEDEGERPPRRQYERRSGTGRGNEIKREGSGRGNWGTPADDVQVTEEAVNENVVDEKPVEEEQVDVKKDGPTDESEVKEPEDKEMTLEEYQKVLEEKRKALQALKAEERKVDAKEFESMQQLSNKKNNDDIFIKLGSDKDKKKEAAEREERARKSLHINEFLKPADGERYYGGRGRGRGRGSRGGFGGGGTYSNAPAPYIEDPGQFPSLGAK